MADENKGALAFVVYFRNGEVALVSRAIQDVETALDVQGKFLRRVTPDHEASVIVVDFATGMASVAGERRAGTRENWSGRG